MANTTDPMLRSSIWNTVRNGLHNALISPADVLDVASAALPSEDNDDALSYTLPFLTGKTVALSGDPRAALEPLHAGCRSLLERVAAARDRTSAVWGQSASSRLAPGGPRIPKKKNPT